MKISIEKEATLLDSLLEKLGSISKTGVRKMIKHGKVLVDGRIVKIPDHTLSPGQVVEIRRPVPAPPFPVLYDDPFLIALEKPPGLLSISTDSEKTDTFYKAVNQYVQLRSNHRERIFIVHRLDREVSGIMLFAKTQEIKEALQKDWGETEKRYVVLVEGHPSKKEDTIRSWLKESPDHKVRSCPEGLPAKHAVTHYRQLRTYPRHTLLEVRLETGRKHQIRAHLSEMGCPVAGDRKYGAGGNPLRRLGLHACVLSFTHPVTGKRLRLESPVPKVFVEFTKRK